MVFRKKNKFKCNINFTLAIRMNACITLTQRTRLLIIALLFVVGISKAQTADTLQLCYYKQSPYAFNDNGIVRGIEVEIIQEYLKWLELTKKVKAPVKFLEYSSFEDFYFSFKRLSGNRIGMGSVTINTERTKELDFTAPYLKDVAFLITNGNSPDIKTKTPTDVMRALGSMTAVTMNNTSLHKYMLELKKEHLRDATIVFEQDETKILDDISKNVLHFGYVNAVTFWYYLRSNPKRFLKMHKALSKSTQNLGFILPKESVHKAWFDEFFVGPTGFKKSAQYRALLEKYLGTYMAQNIAVN